MCEANLDLEYSAPQTCTLSSDAQHLFLCFGGELGSGSSRSVGCGPEAMGGLWQGRNRGFAGLGGVICGLVRFISILNEMGH